MKKIVITGGLGYVGTELCNLYSGESRFNNIVVVDKRFASHRVSQLRDWGIDFVQGDILDRGLLSEVLEDASIVYHLAGITDVAYTQTDSDSIRDARISRVAIKGSRNVIESSPKDCKIVFPSTHVVYEGFEDTEFGISENVETSPILTYSKSKDQTERDLFESDRNFVVLRLASVYGYSSDMMRVSIMPNLFSRITSQNGIIKLFSGGVQHKSLVSLSDVVRCFKFMGESPVINREIFHLSNENMTVKEVAEICKEINPSVTIVETDDEIPNLGYTLSNKKLLSTGFEFRCGIRQSIEQMIKNWSRKELDPSLEIIQSGSKEFIDRRGKISNYELTEPINLIGYIESKAGTVRANHYHPIQEQKCLLVKGRYISVIKDLADPDSVIETNVVSAGDISIIKPNVAHAMVFLEDSVFLNLVRGEREHENYGVTHTISYELVDEKFSNELIQGYKDTCRVSGSKNLKTVLSLGNSPLANNLLEDENQEDECFPLQINFCPESYNVQLSHSVPREKMFNHYLYVSSTTETFRKHFSDLADKLIDQFDLDENSFVVDVGSNDGVFLIPLMEKGVRICGVEPAKNLAKTANEKGVLTVNGYFEDEETVKKIEGKADLVTAFNVFAHSDNLTQITTNAFDIMKPNGKFIIEVQYLLDTLRDLTFDNIYHEHYNYWSVISLERFFNRFSLHINSVEHIATHGGSIRVFVGKDPIADSSVSEFIDMELEYGLDKIETYKEFADRVKCCKKNAVAAIKKIKSEGKTIVGYGSPAKATTVLNYYGIGSESIDYIIEDNEMKHSRLLPGVRIPITSKQKALSDPPDYILVLAWNYFDYIREHNADLVDYGCKFITLKQLEKTSTRQL